MAKPDYAGTWRAALLATPTNMGRKGSGLARETKFNHGGDHSKDSNGVTIHSQPLQQELVGDEGTLQENVL